MSRLGVGNGRVIGNFPIGTLAAFPGLGIDHATVDHLLGRLPAQ